MSKFIQGEDVLQKASHYVSEKLELSRTSINRHKFNWRCLVEFATRKQIVLNLNDAESVRQAVSLYAISEPQEFEKRDGLSRSLNILVEFVRNGKILSTLEKTDFSGSIGQLMFEYISEKDSERLRPASLLTYERQLSRFLAFLKESSIHNVQEIDVSSIYRYIKTLPTHCKSNTYIAISVTKRFMKWLYERGLVSSDVSLMIPSGRYTQQSELPSVYSKDEIEQILDSVDRGNPAGKRNYLMLLLGARLGLRSSDICNLKFSDIHWEENLIELKQVKTAKTITLPLLPEVGNAIIDYLKYGRPKSDLPYVLLSAKGDVRKMRGKTVCQVANEAFRNARIDIGRRRHGAHALRHSLAARLLESQTTMPVISEILGHADTSSTLYYLRIDITTLKACALDVAPIGEGFYEQFK